jgi:hypothetical protein
MMCRWSRLYCALCFVLTAIDVVAPQTASGAQNVLKIFTTVAPEKYSGPCPVDLVFTTTVVTDTPGEITYRWQQDKQLSDIMTSQSATDIHTLETTWTIDNAGGKGRTFHAGARVLTPVEASDKLARAYVQCTSTDDSSNRDQSTESAPAQPADSGDEDAPIVFGTVETETVGDEMGSSVSGGESGGGETPGLVGSTVIEAEVESLSPQGSIRNTLALRCPEYVNFGIVDDIPDPWWSTGSRASNARANVLADARLLTCDYVQGDRQVRVSRKFPQGFSECRVRDDGEFYCTE